MKIAVVGVGYVGLVSGVCLASIGHRVVCVDVDENKIRRLKQGHIPIYEPGLEELMKKCVANKHLSFTTSNDEPRGKPARYLFPIEPKPNLRQRFRTR